MSVLTTIPIDKITEHDRIRSVDPAQVEELKKSINQIGLLNPISVCQSYEAFRLVAGSHRLAAYRELGYTEIEALVMDLTDFERVIAECDENLCGPRLSPAEKAMFVARRQEAYEAIYPPTQHGGDRKSEDFSSRQVGDLKQPDRFTANTAAATGQSERVVQRDAERGRKVIPEVLQLIKGTKLDTGAFLDRVKQLPPNEQFAVAKRDLAIANREQEQSAPAFDPLATVPPRGREEASNEHGDGPTYEDLRAAIILLTELRPEDFHRLCPPNKRAPMCQRLAHLQQICEQVIEGAGQ